MKRRLVAHSYYMKPSRLFIISFLFIITLFSNYPLFQMDLISADDILFHLLRIENIHEGIKQGDLLVKIHSLCLDGRGYGVGLFYPNFFLYIPAVLRTIGFSIVKSYKIFLMILSVFSCISIYFSSKFITKRRYASLIATMIYMLSQYRLINIYQRAAVGEYLGMVFAPILVAGLVDLAYFNFQKPWLLGLGSFLMMMSHTISFFIWGIVVILLIIINFKKVICNKNIIIRLLFTFTVLLIVSSFYWVPMLEQLVSDKFGFSTAKGFLRSYILNLTDFFSIESFGPGLSIIILSAMVLLIRPLKRVRKELIIAHHFFIVAILLLLATTRFVPWRLIEGTPFKSIQFPWRFLASSTLFFSIAIGYYFDRIFKRGERKNIFSLCLLTTVLISTFYMNSILGRVRIEVPNDYYQENINTRRVGGGNSEEWLPEWLPIGVHDYMFFNSRYEATDNNNNHIYIGEKNFNRLEFFLCEESKYLDVPLIYYKGYSATVIDDSENIHRLTLEKSPNNGLIRINNPSNINGKVTVVYTGTTIQTVTLFLSTLSVIILLLAYLMKKNNIYKKGTNLKLIK